jgi:hypothetical protein
VAIMESVCCICLEPLDEEQSTVLPCAHRFHGQCVCNHLLRDTRCPLCRAAPPDASDNASDQDDSDASYVGEDVAIEEAVTRARDAYRTNAVTGKMLTTLKRWERLISSTRRELRVIQRELRPMESHLKRDISQRVRDMHRQFEQKHQRLFEGRRALRRTLVRAQRNARACTLRIAARHGFDVN